MPKAPKKKVSDRTGDAALAMYRTYSDVSSLSMAELNRLCRAKGIDIQYSKSAKMNLLALSLGISTNGKENIAPLRPRQQSSGLSASQEVEFSSLKPEYLVGLPNWSKDITNIPDIDDTMVKMYLRDCSVLTQQMARTYKLSRPFQLKGFIHSMRFHPLPDHPTFMAVQAQCNPSQSASAENVKLLFLIIDIISGQPVGGYCTCTVGFCQACGHMGAALFCLADLVSSGATHLPADPSCTETICQWTDPKAANVEPRALDNIHVGKQRASEPHLRRTADDYGKVVLGPIPSRRPTAQQVMKLRFALTQATQHLGIHVPAVNVLTPTNFPSDIVTPLPPPIETLPDITTGMDPCIIPVYQETVIAKPLPVARRVAFPDESVPEFINRLTLSDDDRSSICEMTQGQNENVEWYHQREGCITSTKMHDIERYYAGAKISADRLTDDCMGYKYRHLREPPKMPNKESLKWGRVNEDKARIKYTQMMSETHENFSVKTTGLVVHPDTPYIRGSPDGIAMCSCHPPRLVEIKCPYTARNLDVDTAIKEKKIKFLHDNHLLNTTSQGYLSQVQACMAITGLKECDFVIYTLKEVKVIRVEFDPVFWANQLHCAKLFFEEHVAPCIMGIMRQQPTKYLPTIDLSCVKVEQSDEEPTRDNTAQSCEPVDSEVYCGQCRVLLPETDFVAGDNSNASVGCECECGCSAWHCWKCARYTEDMAEEEIEWYCPTCVRGCDIIY